MSGWYIACTQYGVKLLNDQVLRKFLCVLLGLQLSHVGGDQPAPVSSMSVELLEAQALHQFVEDACHTH